MRDTKLWSPFSRRFKKNFGCPPSNYQEQHWEKIYEKLPGAIHYRPDTARTGLAMQPQEETTMDIRFVNIEPMRVAFVRHTGPYMECEPAWETLCAWAGPKGLLRMDAKYIGISYDDPQVTPPEKLRYRCLHHR